MSKKLTALLLLQFWVGLFLITILTRSTPHTVAQTVEPQAALPAVTITNIAINNSSAIISFLPVPGAKDYRIYDVVYPTVVKYAGLVHIDTGSSQYFKTLGDGVTPVFPIVALQQTQWPLNPSLRDHFDTPSTQLEWNTLWDHQAHTLVIEAVNQLGPVPMENTYDPNNSDIAPLMKTASSRLGLNMGMTHDGKMSTNGQGNANNNPQAIAVSAPFDVTADGSVKAIPSGPDAGQTFFDTFDNSESDAMKLIDQGYGGNPTGNLDFSNYTLNNGSPTNGWNIKMQAVDLALSYPFLGDGHFMDVIFNQHPGSSWASLGMVPQKSADISGGKILHLTMEVDRDFDYVGRRWVGFQLAPANDPVTNWKEIDFGPNEQPNASSQALFINLYRHRLQSNLYTGQTSPTNRTPVLDTVSDVINTQHMWLTGQSGGAAALDKRSRYDLFATTTHIAIFENGSLVDQYDLPNGGLPYNQILAGYSHYYYHSEAEQPEQEANYPYQDYFTDVYPFSDERHWDNMGFEVLPAGLVPGNDFTGLGERAQPAQSSREKCPADYKCANLGPAPIGGQQQLDGSNWTIRGGAVEDGVSTRNDGGRYVYKTGTNGAGSVTASARLTSLEKTSFGEHWGGVMVRSSSQWLAPMYRVYVSGSGTIHVNYRSSQGGAVTDRDSGVTANLPVYLRVSGTNSGIGNVKNLKGEYSRDGVSWTTLNNSAVAIDLGGTVLAGIGQDSASNIIGLATFDTVNINFISEASINLTAQAASATQVNLAWGNSLLGQGLTLALDRKIGSTGAYTRLVNLGASAVSFQDTNLLNGTAYYYRLNVYNSSGGLSLSKEVTATTSMPAPSGLTATAYSFIQLNLSWTDNSNSETGFLLQRKTGANGVFANLSQIGSNATSYQDVGLQPGTTYFYQLQAVTPYAASGFTTAASATTKTGGDVAVTNGSNSGVGSLRTALTNIPANGTISINSGIIITIEGSALPQVKAGVTIAGVCNNGPVVHIKKGLTLPPGTGGLFLLGNNTLYGLKVEQFPGVQIKNIGYGNRLTCTSVSKN